MPILQHIQDTDNEGFFCQQVVSNVYWRVYEILKPKNLFWQQVYEQHFEHIEENYFNIVT